MEAQCPSQEHLEHLQRNARDERAAYERIGDSHRQALNEAEEVLARAERQQRACEGERYRIIQDELEKQNQAKAAKRREAEEAFKATLALLESNRVAHRAALSAALCEHRQTEREATESLNHERAVGKVSGAVNLATLHFSGASALEERQRIKALESELRSMGTNPMKCEDAGPAMSLGCVDTFSKLTDVSEALCQRLVPVFAQWVDGASVTLDMLDAR